MIVAYGAALRENRGRALSAAGPAKASARIAANKPADLSGKKAISTAPAGAAHQPSGQGFGRRAVAEGDLAAQDGRVIAGRLLDDTAAAGGQVGSITLAAQPQPVEVDYVEVGAIAGRSRPRSFQPDDARGIAPSAPSPQRRGRRSPRCRSRAQWVSIKVE